MAIAAVLDGSTIHESDVDVRSVAQLSAVGTLADEVLADLIKADAGVLPTSESSAIRRASDLFSSAVQVAQSPASLWTPSGLADALRKMSAPAGVGPASVASSDNAGWLEWLKRVASALASAVVGEADRNDLDLLRVDFTAIAAGTMDATQDALRSRLYSASWLTA